MLQNLTHSLQLRPTKAHVLYELTACISSAVSADGFRLYLVESSDSPDKLTYLMDDHSFDENGEPRLMKITTNVAIPEYVAKYREVIRFSRGDRDPRFAEGLSEKSVGHILCQAIVHPGIEFLFKFFRLIFYNFISIHFQFLKKI